LYLRTVPILVRYVLTVVLYTTRYVITYGDIKTQKHKASFKTWPLLNARTLVEPLGVRNRLYLKSQDFTELTKSCQSPSKLQSSRHFEVCTSLVIWLDIYIPTLIWYFVSRHHNLLTPRGINSRTIIFELVDHQSMVEHHGVKWGTTFLDFVFWHHGSKRRRTLSIPEIFLLWIKNCTQKGYNKILHFSIHHQ
jgi:hypothetical protein